MELQYRTAFKLELDKALLEKDFNLASAYFADYRKKDLVNCNDLNFNDQLFRTMEVVALRATTAVNETLIKIVKLNLSQPEEIKKLKEQLILYANCAINIQMDCKIISLGHEYAKAISPGKCSAAVYHNLYYSWIKFHDVLT